MLDFVIFAVTFLVALIVAIIWLYPSSKKITTIPGLDPTNKEDGNLGDIARAGSLHEFLQELHGQFGDISGFWWGSTYVVSIASPELFKAHANVFDCPRELYQLFEPLIGRNSLKFANGADGRKRRKIYDRAFSHENLQKCYSSFQETAKLVEKKWSKRSESDHVPLCEDMSSFAIRTGLMTLLGDNFEDEKLVLSFNNAFSKAWSELEHRLKDGATPEENSVRQKSLSEAIQYMQKTLQKVLENRKQISLPEDQQLLVDIISQSTTDEEVFIINDVMTYLVGGFFVTANLATWAVYFLAANPDVQTKLHKEIVETLGQKDIVSQENYGKLRYTRQVIDETLRCAVVSTKASRVQDFDSELGGHKVPKNTPVVHAIGVVLQDEQLWPLPHSFDPDRFNDENSKNRSNYAFTPFGFAGKRQCPAYEFSYLEATILLVTLIRKFEVKLWENQVVKPVFGLVTHPQDEIWVKLIKRT